MDTIKTIHSGQNTNNKSAPASSAKTAEQAKAEEVATFADGANGGTPLPQTPVGVEVPPVGAGVALPAGSRGRSLRRAVNSRSPHRQAATVPPRTADAMETNTQQKRGAEQLDGQVVRVQLNPTTVDIEKKRRKPATATIRLVEHLNSAEDGVTCFDVSLRRNQTNRHTLA